MSSPRAFILALVGLTLATTVGCSESKPGISVAIAGQFRRSAGGNVDLVEANPGDWDRVCVLGPYSSNDTAKRTLGFAWDVEGRTPIRRNDGIAVLLFVHGKQVSEHVEHPRNLGDFAHLSGKCIPRAQARFYQASDSERGPAGLYPKSQ
jgi:hypothetical protein